MVKRRKPSDEAAAPPQPIYAPTLGDGFQATTARIQEMHQAISSKTFDSLLLVPGLSVPTRIVQSVHDAITQGVYAAVRHGGAAALTLASGAERLASDPQRVPGRKERVLRSVLNGAVGDALVASGSALAVQMGLHDHDGPLALSAFSLATLRPRVCVFLHGLACDEQSWQLRTDAWTGSPWAEAMPAGEAVRYGALLERELGISALYLRYNSGLSVENNARQFAELMQRVAAAAPQVREWQLVGHSMGGLVARAAQVVAAAQGLAWSRQVPTIICLGSPHQGAPLEKLGHMAAAALEVSEVTRPLARLANARSRGIKDLRHGHRARAAAPSAALSEPALRLVYATLGDEAGGGIGSFVGSLFGDGLVRAGSAADDGLQGDVERVELAGLGHMSLLNHPRVYAVIRRWLGAAAD